MITVGEVWDTMQRGEVFSLRAVKYNRQAKTGGDFITIEAGRVEKTPANKKATGPGDNQAPGPKVADQWVAGKNPRHRKNHTVNIRILQDGVTTSVIKKVHVPLVVEFNGKIVLP